jgi:acyl carrier protein phosphodiesterase
LITDLISKADERALDPEIQHGVAFHRRIDHLTDAHPIFIEHKRSLYPHFSKYSPVVLDIIYDYLLESNWAAFSDESFDDFQARLYEMLLENLELIPEHVRTTIMRMTADRWLRHYSSIEGLDKVFVRLQKKVKFNQSFETVTKVLQENEARWVLEHRSFFSEVKLQLDQEAWLSPQNETKY